MAAGMATAARDAPCGRLPAAARRHTPAPRLARRPGASTKARTSLPQSRRHAPRSAAAANETQQLDLAPEPAAAPSPQTGVVVEGGYALPYGTATRAGGRVNFAVAARHARQVTLCLYALEPPAGEYNAGGVETIGPRLRPLAEVSLDGDAHRTGDVWHCCVGGLFEAAGPGCEVAYGFRARGKAGMHAHCNARRVCADPMASGPTLWLTADLSDAELRDGSVCRALSVLSTATAAADTKQGDPFCGHAVHTHTDPANHGAFDWGGAEAPVGNGARPEAAHYYEVDLRSLPFGALASPDSDAVRAIAATGATAVVLGGMASPHLLGAVTTAAAAAAGVPWGASADACEAGARQIVRSLHAAGLAVLVDARVASTAEDGDAQVVGFAGLDSPSYYRTNDVGNVQFHGGGAYSAGLYTTAASMLDLSDPMVHEAVLHSLRRLQRSLCVDGFRVLDAWALPGDGGPAISPLSEAIAHDPELAGARLVVQPWALDRVGTFAHWGRWSELNPAFANAAHSFFAPPGTRPGNAAAMAADALRGSRSRVGNARFPYQGINYLRLRDETPIADSVAPGDHRLVKNLLLLAYVARGAPWVAMGDEYGFSRGGAERAHPGAEIMDLSHATGGGRAGNEFASEILGHVEALADFRRRRTDLLCPIPPQTDADLDAAGVGAGFRTHDYGGKPGDSKWTYGSEWAFAGETEGSQCLVAQLSPAKPTSGGAFVALNGGEGAVRVALPANSTPGMVWRRVADTAMPSAVAGLGSGDDLPGGGAYVLQGRAAVLFEEGSA